MLRAGVCLVFLVGCNFFCKFNPKDNSFWESYFLIQLIDYSTKESRFTITGSMNVARTYHTASVLSSGKVLIAGGASTTLPSASDALNTAEIYDPTAKTFTLTGNMQSARVYHTATVLNDGKVLITGGANSTNDPSNTAELFDPTTETFTLVSNNMNSNRKLHTATLLQNGNVLIAGGINSSASSISNTTEIYDSTAGTFTLTGNTNSVRKQHASTLLNSGKVLITGGSDGSNGLNTAEIYDSTTGTFTLTGNMNSVRADHTTTLLQNGKVFIVGGSADSDKAEIYDSTTETFLATSSSMQYYEYASTVIDNPIAITLNSGLVLLAGGGFIQSGGVGNTFEYAIFYSSGTDEASSAGVMNYKRQIHTASLLQDGTVLIAGGNDSPTTVTNTAEIFDPNKFILLGR